MAQDDAYTDAMEYELRIEQKRTWSDTLSRASVWLILDGKAIAWAVFEEGAEYGDYFCLCDIETRPGYQGKGYARKLIEMLVAHTGKPVAGTGSFTPEGWKSFGDIVPVLSGYPVPSGPSFRSMTFVDDWDRFYAPS
jgi:GNAT superfamily N-acetyltransferase